MSRTWLALGRHAFQHPHKPGTILIPQPGKELGKDLAAAIRRQAGLKAPK